jgi:hypothetical protein
MRAKSLSFKDMLVEIIASINAYGTEEILPWFIYN